MNIEKDKKTLSLIMAATGILLFVLVVGIVIFSLPDTTADTNPSQTVETAKSGARTEVILTVDEAEDEETEESAQEMQETAVSTTAAPVSVHLVAYGDNLLHKGVSNCALKADGSYDFTEIYSLIAPGASSADIAVVNQEVPLGGTELGIQGYPNFNAPHEVADALYASGVDVLSMATNHVLDMGAAGVVSTLEYINSRFPDMLTTGAYLSQEARDAVPVCTANGVHVAFLNYTYGLNGHSSSQVFINMIDDELMKADVQKARQEADIVVVCMHWGDENILTPTDEQKRLAQLLCDAGADLILGTHPHVVQPVTMLTGSDGHKTLVYYSLGNLVSLQHLTQNMLGGVADVTFSVQDGEITDVSYGYSFVVTQFNDAQGGVITYPWESYTRELAAEHGIIQFDSSFSYEALENLISQVWSGQN